MSTRVHPSHRVSWPDEVDEILDGDLVATIGTVTCAHGVALANVEPLGLRDRRAGTVGFHASAVVGRKLERIIADPHLAIAYHTRQHGLCQRPGYVLIQGMATVTGLVGPWLYEKAARRGDKGYVADGLWGWWLEAFNWDRVLVTVQVTRILWWPDGDVSHPPTVLGEPLPDRQPPSQPPPRQPELPRVAVKKVARHASRGHRLLGVLQSDGMPLILPVDVTAATSSGLSLRIDTALLPKGERRAGFLAHDFNPRLVGVWAATHTGWLRTDPSPVWTPHTRHFMRSPSNRTALLLVMGLITRASRPKARHTATWQRFHLNMADEMGPSGPTLEKEMQ